MTRRAKLAVRFAGVAAAILIILALGSGDVLAQQPGTGVRAGVSADPDQFYFGAHFDTGPIFDRVSFRPNAEIGVGNDLTTVSGNFEFVYWWRMPRHPWNVYAGGGPAINFYKANESHGGGDNTEPGFNLLIGLAHRRGFFAEVKLGLIDSPDFKFGVGYTWR